MTKEEIATELLILANNGLQLVEELKAIDVQIRNLTAKGNAIATEMDAIRDVTVKLKAQYDVV